MSSLNKTLHIGRPGKDPEVKCTANGKTVATFDLATSKTWKDKAGNKQEKTEWHHIIAWGKLAEIAEEYTKKGKLTYVEGELTYNKYEDKNGVKRERAEIQASVIRNLEPKSNGTQGNKQSSGGYDDHGPADNDFIPEIEEDDVPL